MRLSTLGFSVAVIGLIAGCDGYARTNPLDPNFDLGLTLEGPDTIYSFNDTVQFKVTTEPSRPDLAFTWASSDELRLAPMATSPGRFISIGNGIITLSAEYGPHKVERQVVVLQRAVKLKLTPPPVSEIESLNETIQFAAAVVDAKGSIVPLLTSGIVWTTSDVLVAEVNNGKVTSRSNGDVWVKAASFEKSDSIKIRVKQKATTLTFNNDDYKIFGPGGQVTTGMNIRDARGVVILPSTLVMSSSRPGQFSVSPNGVVRSLNSFGSVVITAKLDGLEARTTVRVSGGTAPVVGRFVGGLTRLDLAGSPTNIVVTELDSQDAESDLEEATIEVYSVPNPLSTFLVAQSIGLDQGKPTFTSTVMFQGYPTAGTARVRLRDTAENLSLGFNVLACNCVSTVSSNPKAGSPDLTILSAARVAGDSLDVNLSAVAGEADLRAVYVMGIDSNNVIVFFRRTLVQQTAGTTVTFRAGAGSPDASRAVRVGVLVSDVNGNLSLIRTRGI